MLNGHTCYQHDWEKHTNEWHEEDGLLDSCNQLQFLHNPAVSSGVPILSPDHADCVGKLRGVARSRAVPRIIPCLRVALEAQHLLGPVDFREWKIGCCFPHYHKRFITSSSFLWHDEVGETEGSPSLIPAGSVPTLAQLTRPCEVRPKPLTCRMCPDKSFLMREDLIWHILDLRSTCYTQNSKKKYEYLSNYAQ